MNVSMFENSYAFEGKEADVESILWAIKNGWWKDRIDILRRLLSVKKEFYDAKKVRLPGVTFSGTFSQRRIEGLINYSNLVCLDVDGRQHEIVKRILMEEQYVYSMFASPSNKGIKILVWTDNQPGNHKEAILHLIDYFKVYHGIDIDSSCKDVSRLCYVSYDPDLRFNPSSVTFNVDVDKYFIPPPAKSEIINPINASLDIPVTFDFCTRMAEGYFPYYEGNRNNHFFFLSSLLNERGVELQEALNLINGKYTSVPHDCLSTIKYIYRKNSHKFNTKLFQKHEAEITKLGGYS